MTDEVFISKRKEEVERKRAEYERFDRCIDENTIRALGIAAFIDERNYLDTRPDEVRS
jgi:hypothetical protein